MRQKLYWNGTILTMETSACAQALLEQDGKIVAIGALDEVRRAAGTHFECVDLQGHTLMPSFIDAHSHFMGYAMSLLQVSVEGAHSFSDIQKELLSLLRTDICRTTSGLSSKDTTIMRWMNKPTLHVKYWMRPLLVTRLFYSIVRVTMVYLIQLR